MLNINWKSIRLYYDCLSRPATSSQGYWLEWYLLIYSGTGDRSKTRRGRTTKLPYPMFSTPPPYLCRTPNSSWYLVSPLFPSITFDFHPNSEPSLPKRLPLEEIKFYGQSRMGGGGWGAEGFVYDPGERESFRQGRVWWGVFLSLASLAERSASCLRVRLVELMLTVDAVSGFVDDVFPLL